MIILDTSFIVSYFNKRDQNHLQAVKLMEEVANITYGPLSITDSIFGEVVTVCLLRLKSLRKASQIGNTLLNSMKIIEVDKTSFDQAWHLFSKQKSTIFSFTDCTTVSVMRENDIKNIATFDEDFGKIKGINTVGL